MQGNLTYSAFLGLCRYLKNKVEIFNLVFCQKYQCEAAALAPLPFRRKKSQMQKFFLFQYRFFFALQNLLSLTKRVYFLLAMQFIDNYDIKKYNRK